MSHYLMQAASSVDGAIYTWTDASPDFAASGYPGDGTATDVAVAAAPAASSGGGGAPTNASYVTLAVNGSLSSERVLAAGSGIGIADGGAGGNVTVSASGIVNANIDAAAAIAGTKIAPNFGTQSMGAKGLYANEVLTLTDAGPTTYDDYAIGSNSMLYVVNSTGLITFNGFAAPSAGVYQDLIIIGQQAGAGFTLIHDAAGSSAANRIYINGGLSGTTFYSAHLRYIHDQSRWCLAAYPV